MPVLKLQDERFLVKAPLIDRRRFEGWLCGPGKVVQADELRRLRFRWFFGSRRVETALYNEVRRSVAPGSMFADDLERELNGLAVFIRKVAITIQRRGYRDLFTAEGSRLLIVVPRGIIRVDFAAHLDRILGDSPQLRRFPGLARTILGRASSDAETIFFDYILRGKQPIDKTGRGFLAGADSDYPWRFGNIKGHYLYATTARNDVDLYDKRQLKRFKKETEELRKGQEEYIRRLRSYERSALAAAFGVSDN